MTMMAIHDLLSREVIVDIIRHDTVLLFNEDILPPAFRTLLASPRCLPFGYKDAGIVVEFNKSKLCKEEMISLIVWKVL